MRRFAQAVEIYNPPRARFNRRWCVSTGCQRAGCSGAKLSGYCRGQQRV